MLQLKLPSLTSPKTSGLGLLFRVAKLTLIIIGFGISLISRVFLILLGLLGFARRISFYEIL